MQGPVLNWHKSRGLGFTCVSSPEKKKAEWLLSLSLEEEINGKEKWVKGTSFWGISFTKQQYVYSEP